MGTNYYHRTNICSCCGRYDETHICKSMLTFEAVIEWGGEYDSEQIVTVGSWAQWKERIRAEGEVWDEYGELHPGREVHSAGGRDRHGVASPSARLVCVEHGFGALISSKLTAGA